jgi:hypothetical protein
MTRPEAVDEAVRRSMRTEFLADFVYGRQAKIVQRTRIFYAAVIKHEFARIMNGREICT